jgi:hypothetical protein
MIHLAYAELADGVLGRAHEGRSLKVRSQISTGSPSAEVPGAHPDAG